MSLGGKLTGVDIMNATEEELDILLGYTEEYNKYIAELNKKNGTSPTNRTNNSKIDLTKNYSMNKPEERRYATLSMIEKQKEAFMNK